MVSIIIPIYNSEFYLDSCIESILNQDCKDFELLLINDGSNDNSWNICQTWAMHDGRVRAFTQDNAGASAARNYGLSVAKGEWILFVDSDDKVLPQYASNLIEATKKDRNIVLAVSGVQVYRDMEPAEKRGFPNLKCDISDYKKLFGDIRLHKYGFSVGKLYKREIIESYHLRFDEKICIAEDCMFMLNYLMHCSETPDSKISFIEKCDYLYYIHQNSLSTGTSSVERELYSYNKYRETINAVRQALNVDSTTFGYMHSPIVFYADRIINSLYNNVSSASARRSLLGLIDKNEYKQYKKVHSPIEKLLVFLFSNGYLYLYDILRRLF